MRHFTLLFLLAIVTDSWGQIKPKRKPQEFKTDTVDIFANTKKKFYKDEATFRFRDNKVELIYTQEYDNTCCVDDESTSNLVMTFDNWNALELNKDYNVANLQAVYEVIAFLGPEYDKPIGRIRLINKTKTTLTVNLDITVQSTSKRILEIFKGDRVFKRSK